MRPATEGGVRIAIEGGRVLLPDGTSGEMTVTIADGRIIGVGHAIAASRRWRVHGLLVLPGIVDLHGDAFEKYLMPRSGVHMPLAVALHAVDRQLLACGITTAYHGLSLTWEPGLRSSDTARRVIAALADLRPLLHADTRVHLRFESLALDAVEELVEWIEAGRIDLLAFNDHSAGLSRNLARNAGGGTALGRSGLSHADYRALLEAVQSRRDEVPAALSRLAQAAAARAVPLASHDDESPQAHRQFHALGCRLCEFPVDIATAEAAVAAGDAVILGAPNVLRGKSHEDRVSARQAVGDRLCSVLTSDYFYPALLTGPFVLARERVLDFGRAWQLVSANPAAAAGLDDRGAVEVGRRADLVLVDDTRPDLPVVATTIVGGEIAHIADGRLATALEHFPGSET
jgi:alpha-D-ribose 1-methylphosphonate 5-triphosphate diphosphatase